MMDYKMQYLMDLLERLQIITFIGICIFCLIITPAILFNVIPLVWLILGPFMVGIYICSPSQQIYDSINNNYKNLHSNVLCTIVSNLRVINVFGLGQSIWIPFAIAEYSESLIFIILTSIISLIFMIILPSDKTIHLRYDDLQNK